MDDSEGADVLCNDVMDAFEHKRAIQTNSFNRVEEDWIRKPLWEPLNLILNPLWIDEVLPWGSANIISLLDYVKRVILLTVLTWSKLSKTGYYVPSIECWPGLTCTIKTVSFSLSFPIVSPAISKGGDYAPANGEKGV